MSHWQGNLYDTVAAPQLKWGNEVVDRLRLDTPTDRRLTILDAGCGSGRVTESLLGRHPDGMVVAADVSVSMLEEAERRLALFGDRVRLTALDLEGDIGAGLQQYGPFDAVLSTGTFHWVRDHSAMYTRLAQILRPGGALVAQCGGEGSVAEVRSILDDIGIEWRSFNRYAGPSETAVWMRDAGFTSVWTWLAADPVAFSSREELIEYLLGGVLAPYIAHLPPAEQREVSETVADRLERLTVPFVRLNILGRRT